MFASRDSNRNPYAGGTAYTNFGDPLADYDLVFSEGLNRPLAPVPLPGALPLMATGGAFILLLARRRRIQPIAA